MAEGSAVTILTPYQGLCFWGKVTEVVSATQFRIAGLAGKGDGFFVNYDAYVVRDAGGTGAAPQGEQQTVGVYSSATGLFTTAAYTANLAVGDEILLVNVPVLGGSSTITTPSGVTVANWNAAEADLVSLGANDTNYKVHSLMVGIIFLVGTITIRMYSQLNGTEVQVYSQDVTVAADGPAIWLINGSVGIHEVLRVTCQSDNAADDGQPIGYDAMLEEL